MTNGTDDTLHVCETFRPFYFVDLIQTYAI